MFVAPDPGIERQLPAVVWSDDDPEGWAECVIGLARSADVSHVFVGGRGRDAALDRLVLAGQGADVSGKITTSGTASLSRLVVEVLAAMPGDLLVMVCPYRLDHGMCRRGIKWLRSDRRFAAVTGWEIGDDLRALTAGLPGASDADLSAMSHKLENRLGTLRPVPVTAVHNGVALLGRSSLEVLQGLDPALDAQPSLSLMEFSIRCQRRGFISVLDPVSVSRPLRTHPLPAYSSLSQAVLAERFKFMPAHFEHEAATERTPFGMTRLLARRALDGLHILVHQRPGTQISPLLTRLMDQAVDGSSIASLVLVTGGGLSHEEIRSIPVSPKVTVTTSFDTVVGPVDLLFKGLDAVVPERIEHMAKRVVLELHPDRPEELAGIEMAGGRTPDALLVDSPRTIRWLREVSRRTPLDRSHMIEGIRIVQGPRQRRAAQIPFGPEAAGMPFALCIAPHYDGPSIDAARRALFEAGQSLPLLVIDSLAGPEHLGSNYVLPTDQPVLILAMLSAGERAWCRAHAAKVFDHTTDDRVPAGEQGTDRFIELCFDILSRQPRSP